MIFADNDGLSVVGKQGGIDLTRLTVLKVGVGSQVPKTKLGLT